jgi:hypothetical protein
VGATLTRRRIVMVIAIAATGFVLSLGTGTPVYGWLYEAFPPMQGLRAAARFGNLVLLGLAVLAAIGLVAARPYIPPRRVGAVMAALVIAANIESLRAPFEYTRFQGIPAVYSLLRQEPGNVVLVEVPFYRPEAVFENSRYVLNSTAHWRPLMNGYSGYTPESYRRNSEIFWHFPEDHAIQAMRRAGATHVMVHADRWGDGPEGEDLRRKILASPHLEGIAMSPGGVMLYRLR